MLPMSECLDLRNRLIDTFYRAYPTLKAYPRLIQVERCGIEYSETMRTRGGVASYRGNKIILNKKLLSKNPEHFEQTFAHELAHLLSFATYGTLGTGHGLYWKRIMKVLGYPPERCHNMDASDVRRKHAVLAYAKCACRTIEIKARRYRKIQSGTHYQCTMCRKRLVLCSPKEEMYVEA